MHPTSELIQKSLAAIIHNWEMEQLGVGLSETINPWKEIPI